MSIDEDTELRDLVAQTLETNGILNKMRAELRANVFLALEEKDALRNSNIRNKKLDRLLATEDGQLIIGLVYEFLEYYNCDSTIQVLEPESGNIDKFLNREEISKKLKINSAVEEPLLQEVLRKSKKSEMEISLKLNASKEPHRQPEELKQAEKSKDTLTSFVKERNEKNNLMKKDRLLVTDTEDDELLRELGIADSPPPSQKSSAKPSWLDSSPSKKGAEEELKTPGSLGSLKNAPPLPGLSAPKNKQAQNQNILETSGDWSDLAKIDQKMQDLGFEVPKDDDYNYDDDFQASSQKSGHSITEEIEEELSIGSFAESKHDDDDLVTEDQTISQISDGGYDYVEDMDRQHNNSL